MTVTPISTDLYDETLAILSDGSVNRHFDPYLDIDWDNLPMDAEDPRWVLHPDVDPLGATAWYQAQPIKRQIEIGRWRTSNAIKVGAAFESILIRGMLQYIMKLPNGSPEFRYCMHEMTEECNHIQMFQELVNRIGADVPGPRKHFRILSPFIGVAGGYAYIILFMGILGGEEPIDHYQKAVIRQGDVMPPAVLRCMQIHIAEEARRQGMDIRPQIAGRPTGVLHGLTSSFNVFSGHPTYRRELAHLPLEQKVEAMRRPEIRAALLGEQSAMRAGAMSRGPEQLLWLVFPLGERPNYEPNREDSVAGLAQAAGVPPLEMMYDLLLRDGGRELFYQPLGAYGSYNFDFFRKNMEHPKVLFGLSDGGAHCGVIADAGMPTFILSYWGRDRVKGDRFPVEFLVRKLTSDTARAYGLRDRGEIKPGLLADLNVIDFDALRLFRPEAVYDLPAGGKRLVQRAEGYRYTIKSGQVTFEDGRHTGALPGALVRGGREAKILAHAAE